MSEIKGALLTHLFPMHLSLPPEYIRKTLGFLLFSGGRERCIGNKWVNSMFQKVWQNSDVN